MKHYGIIGCPLAHSFSKPFFNEKFRNEGIDAIYENYEIKNIDKLLEILASDPKLEGLNVTSPYKQKVLEFLDEMSPEVRAIGACNILKIEQGKGVFKIKGYNGDYMAFKQSIEPMLEKHHTGALILGTGGAAKTVELAMKELGYKTAIVSRYERPGTVNYNRLTIDDLKTFNVIINATPCGMYPHINECPPIPYEGIDRHTLMYDLIYNPDETLFLKKGREHGAVTKNGIEMHLLQAIESWNIWNRK